MKLKKVYVPTLFHYWEDGLKELNDTPLNFNTMDSIGFMHVYSSKAKMIKAHGKNIAYTEFNVPKQQTNKKQKL